MSRYALSFTACPMRRPECVTIVRSYRNLGDWAATRTAIQSDDILMIRSESSRKRIGSELLKRLKNLSNEEIDRLANSTDSHEQTALTWIAICRTYKFIQDFLRDVVAIRWQEELGDLPQGAYECYVEEASVLHPELATISEATKGRLRNQLFQMMREAGIIDSNNVLQPYLLPLGMQDRLSPNERAFFPTANMAK